ncbi:MFS transporter [Nocardia sp. CT2-14]|uniref:MFS transporter n=2 Tax=Nocardia aurantiaca TaxID=2675850 RepID=A0A6I3KTI9_9NOCA|nr:MFS transporter [Nocardia aurantiaca]
MARPAAVGSPGESDNSLRTRTTDLLVYATGSIGMGVWITVPGLLLLYFLTRTLGVSPLLAGLTLVLPKIVDVLIHPLFGYLSDRQARRAGHRRGMLRAGLPLGLAMLAMFTVPQGFSGPSAALWVGGWLVTGNLLFAAFQVPYLTTPSDLPVGYHERTRVFMFRMLMLTVGLLGAGAAAPALVHAGGRADYARMALILAVVMIAAGVIGLAGVRRLTERRGFRVQAEVSHAGLGDLRNTLRDSSFRALVLSYLLTGTTTHLFLAAVPFYTEYVVRDKDLTAILVAGFLSPALFAGPGWMWLSRRIGKQRGLLLAQGIFIAGSLALLPGSAATPAVSVAIVAVLGIAFAGLQLLAFAMVPDAVAAAETRGSARAGSYTGVWTATDAFGSALGPYAYSAVLTLGGFVSATEGHAAAQSDTARTAILLGFTVLPTLLMVLAFLFQRRCALDAGATE